MSRIQLKIYILFLQAFVLFMLPKKARCQSTADLENLTVDLNDLDKKVLNTLIFIEVNKLRDSLNLPLLTEDYILAKAAGNQAEFITKEKRLTHTQQKEKYKNVKDRVEAFNGNHIIVGENLLAITVQKPFTIKHKNNQKVTLNTYKEVAVALVDLWFNSREHSLNIKNPDFSDTGIAVEALPSENRVFAVQVFGRKTLNDRIGYQVPRDLYGIKNPAEDLVKRCYSCLKTLQTMPPDVKMGLHLVDKNIIFVFSDKKWFDQIFTDNTDGIAVDIVARSQYTCGKEKPSSGSWAYRGILLQPVYLKELREKSIVENGELYMKVGDLPAGLDAAELEFNLLILKNNYLCRYNAFFDIPNHKWNLLEMGLFMDTLNQSGNIENSILLNKRLKFIIPFEKDKFEFAEKDIRPLYDSLRLNTFNIKSIAVRAYSSVEGTIERNHLLQQKRAESIIRVLQTYQIDTIRKDITTSENWVEFIDDIAGTKYDYLKNFSKDEIKDALANETVSAELEPVLKKHRKGILFIELEKKNKFNDITPSQLPGFFKTAIKAEKVNEAIEIQKVIFERIKLGQLSKHLLDSLEIPQKEAYGLLINNKYVFRYTSELDSLQAALENFQKLAKLAPSNVQARYNICALKLKSWLSGDYSVEPMLLLNEIRALEKLNLDKRLVKRLLINFHIIISEYFLQQKNYTEKDKAVKFIYTNYKNIEAKEEDILNIANYFVGYSKYEWAKQLLTPLVKNVDVNEDLLFYYLNLTIVDSKITVKQNYRSIMLNAVNINRSRFCNIFSPFGKGGITFQLLEDPFLKKTYCENCLAR